MTNKNNSFKRYYLVVLDADKIEAIKEICTRNGKTISLQEMARKTLVEQHKDCLDRAHICFYSPIPFPKKSAYSVLGLEVKGLMFCSPSLHKNGHPYEIMGTSQPISLTIEQAKELMLHIDSICEKHNQEYLEKHYKNLFDLLGSLEEGQVVIAEDELDDIDNDPDKKRLYKIGYDRHGLTPKTLDGTLIATLISLVTNALERLWKMAKDFRFILGSLFQRRDISGVMTI